MEHTLTLTYESGNLSVSLSHIFGEETKQVRQTQMLVPSSTELPEDVLWTVGNNHSLGTFPRSNNTNNSFTSKLVDSLTLIGGELGGLRIENNLNLVGTPHEVKLLKTFTFVLRARKGNDIED